MEIVQVEQLKIGDRFAKRDWMDSPDKRIVNVVVDFKPTTDKKKNYERKTIYAQEEATKHLVRVKKSDFVFRLDPVVKDEGPSLLNSN